MSFKTMKAIFEKQCKDLLKNMERLLLFIIYPIVAAVITNTMITEGVPPTFFVSIFATMHAIFSPIMVASTMVAEEKEKKTLRELMLAKVTTMEFLVSIGSSIFVLTFITAIPFLIIGEYQGMQAVGVMLCIAVGSLVSIILGMSLGALAKNSVSVNAFAMPAGMILSFGPMLAGFNSSIYKVTRFLYGQQISDWIQDTTAITARGILVVLVNCVVILLIFVYAIHKSRKDR